MEFSLVEDVNETYIHVTDRDLDFYVLPLVNINGMFDSSLAEVIFVTPCCKEESSLIDWEETGSDELFCPKCETSIPNTENMTVSVFLDRDSDDLPSQCYYELYYDIFESILRATAFENQMRALALDIEETYRKVTSPKAYNDASPSQEIVRQIVLAKLGLSS